MEELLECQSRLISSPDFHSDFRLGGQKSQWKQVTSKKLLAKWLTSLLQVQLPRWWEQSVSPFLQTLLLCRHTQRGKGLTTAHHTTPHHTTPHHTAHTAHPLPIRFTRTAMRLAGTPVTMATAIWVICAFCVDVKISISPPSFGTTMLACVSR